MVIYIKGWPSTVMLMPPMYRSMSGLPEFWRDYMIYGNIPNLINSRSNHTFHIMVYVKSWAWSQNCLESWNALCGHLWTAGWVWRWHWNVMYANVYVLGFGVYSLQTGPHWTHRCDRPQPILRHLHTTTMPTHAATQVPSRRHAQGTSLCFCLSPPVSH